MTCRDEILACFDALERDTGRSHFTPQEIIDRMMLDGTRCEATTIRTQIVSKLCVDAPANHAKRYPDLLRVDDGVYRRNREPRPG